MASTTTMAMPATQTTTMSMPMSTSTSNLMSMADMAMVFFSSVHTPLFAEAWTPRDTGSYAGTCIFLVCLAVLLRVLIAFKPILEERVWKGAGRHTHNHGNGDIPLDEDYQKLLHPLQAVGRDASQRWSGWQLGAAAGRATYELAIVGVGYLLMLGVMTMNIGYFASILAGAWFGTFFLGALANDISWAHC